MYRVRINTAFLLWAMSWVESKVNGKLSFAANYRHDVDRMKSLAGFIVNSKCRSNEIFKERRRPKKIDRSCTLHPTTSKMNCSSFSSTTCTRYKNMSHSSGREVKPSEKRIQSVVGQRMDVQDLAIYLTYISSMVTITLPVVLIPMIAADPVMESSNIIMQTSGAELTGKIVALSSLGAGLGKIINGFVCKGLGSRISGSLYLLAMASFSFLLSTTSSLHALAIAGMEFCASIMWPVCNVLIANKYGHELKIFASAISILSICSTAASLSCKVIGSALLSRFHWREVTHIATVCCTLGAGVLYFVVKDKKLDVDKSSHPSFNSEALSIKRTAFSILRVVSNRMFWFVAAAHSCTYLARSCDKMLGSLLYDVTLLPRPLCGSLTALVTIGFMMGLITGRRMESLSVEKKMSFIFKRQIRAVLSALIIAITSTRAAGSILGNHVIATIITLASGNLASSLAVQFYQFPSNFAQKFGDDKAVCISFIDAMAFFVASPIWKIVSNIITSGNFADGWSIAWFMLSAFFALGTGLTMKTFKQE